ncbi:hypothetical protein [Acanthamoeba polyphaga mimivirus]|nr:hypothetical protein [Acanthamoeba castellanii mamavirus]UMZ07746.1 hypothetical protein [Acanthamoeba polyphaga mimivirus]
MLNSSTNNTSSAIINSIETTDIEEKYRKYYVPNDLYWGIGIENESYFMLDKTIERTGEYIKKNRRRERYSVDYNTSYDQEKLTNYLNKLFGDRDLFNIPQYVNSHTLSKTDTQGEHRTLYVIGQKNNPKYIGKSIHELFLETNNLYQLDFNHKYVFDGDTIEFITQNFYKTTVNDCVNELIMYKNKFINDMNTLMKKNNLPLLSFPKINFGLVHFRTNPNNIGIFNNGTYHINLTMPTKLNSQGEIADPILFEKRHKNAIELIKWVEPFIIALYGSPDVFSVEDNQKYSKGSLRLTASRYVSIGTYDTNIMKKGKQLNDLKDSMYLYLYDKSWYNKIYQQTDYRQCDHIGYDINYAKHLNLGIEFRILDYFPEEVLGELIKFIVLILDHSFETKIELQSVECKEWHDFVCDALINGNTVIVPKELGLIMNQFIGFPLIKHNMSIKKYMKKLSKFLHKKYANSLCSRNMSPNMQVPKIYNINKYMWENNFLQYIPINNKNHLKVLKLYHIYSDLKSDKITFDPENNYHSILVNSDLLQESELDLDTFYEKLLKISNSKIPINKYIL